MVKVREMKALDLAERIRKLDRRRNDLWSVAGGAGFAARVCREVLNGERAPSQAILARVGWCQAGVVAAYRQRLAERLTANLLARVEAKAITLEIRKLRGLPMRVSDETTEGL